MLRDILLVATGGSLGAVCRFMLDVYWHFNALIILANILGCFILGLLLGYINLLAIKLVWFKPLVQTGFLGAFTSFSILSTYFYINVDELSLSMLYFALCLITYFILFYLGTSIARIMVSARR